MSGSQYIARVHQLDCVVCFFLLKERTPCAEAHHVLPGDDFSVISLCYEHHQGSTGVHGKHRVGFYRFWKISGEAWLLARTAELMSKR